MSWSDFSIVKARTSHKCCECNKKIEVGERYYKFRGVYEGDFYYYKSCIPCEDLRKEVGKSLGAGVELCFGDLGEEIEQSFDRDHPIYGRAVSLGIIRCKVHSA